MANEWSRKFWFVPVTPGGTPCAWLAAKRREKAIDNLMKDAAHMPYRGWNDFEKRGYTIEQWDHKP